MINSLNLLMKNALKNNEKLKTSVNIATNRWEKYNFLNFIAIEMNWRELIHA